MKKLCGKKIAMILVISGVLMVPFHTTALGKSPIHYHDKSVEKESAAIRLQLETTKTEQALLRKTVVLIPPVQMPPAYNGSLSIMGSPVATKEQCLRYLLSVNPSPNLLVSPDKLVDYYYEEGTREGIRPDIAFAQALKETGYFRYGGAVQYNQNNYCGLGSTSSSANGAYFSNPQMGVRAHIQHLLAYSSMRQPQVDIVDPRYSFVHAAGNSATASTWTDLNGRWAVPGSDYGETILHIYQNILQE